MDFLRKRGFSKAETGRIVETVLTEEGRRPESFFDFVQGITAVARSKPQQDARLAMEGNARALLEKVAEAECCRVGRCGGHLPPKGTNKVRFEPKVTDVANCSNDGIAVTSND